MICKSLFPHLLTASFILTLSTFTAFAQSEDIRPRQVTTVIATSDGTARLETDAVIVSVANLVRPSSVLSNATTLSRTAQLNQLLHAAIDVRLGAPYVYGASGPNRFDCSGFVWSVFHSAGVGFERASARTLWSRFLPAGEEDRTRFGTLVFFSNLSHVGIVADEHGFYHASSSRGVVYSTFNDYWSARIDGFRRVPVEDMLFAIE